MKKIIFSAMMLAALASCSKNENAGASGTGSGTEIMVSGKALSIDTKGAYTGTTPSVATPLKAFVIGSETDGDYTTQYVSGTMTFTDKAAGFDGVKGVDYIGEKKYPAAQAPVYLMGFYPDANKAAAKWAVAANKAELDFVGTEDVMFAHQITTTSVDVAVGGTPKKFEFNHELTLLEVKVVVDGDQDLADAWGVVKELKLVDGQFNNKASVTIVAGLAQSTIAFSNPVTDWAFYTAADAAFTGQSLVLPITGKAIADPDSDLTALNAKATVAATTMVAPHTPTAGTPSYKLAVTTGVIGDTTKDMLTNVNVTLKQVDNTTDFAATTKGYKFSILLNFKSKTIHATATVQAWKDGGTTIAPIE